MKQSESIGEISKALSKFQGELSSVKKESTNPFFKSRYASLTSVWEHIRTPLSKNGLSVVQFADQDMSEDGHLILETILLHTSGEWIGGYLPIKPKADDPQGMGSAITYARRYALSAILGVVADEDDDGEGDKQAKKAEKKPASITIKQVVEKATEKGYVVDGDVSRIKAIMVRVFSVSESQDLNQEQRAELLKLMDEGKFKGE